MKKFISIILILGLLLGAGVVIFVLTFDFNRYRPQIEKQVAAAVGSPVKIGNLSLAWRGGLAIEVDGVQILSNDEPVLKVQSAGAVLQIAPLLRRSLQIGSIFIDGADVRIVKNADGTVEIQGVHPKPLNPVKEVSREGDSAASSTPASVSSPAALTSFLIHSLKLKDIHIHYEDNATAFPIQLDLRKFELSVKNVSLFRPMEFESAAALFSSKQNVHLSGRLSILEQGAQIRVENFKVESDLDALDLNELTRSMPNAMKQMPVSKLSGSLNADIEHLQFQNGKLDDFQADIAFKDGQISAWGASPLLDHVQISIDRFRLNAPIDFKVKGAVLADESNLNLQGRLELGETGRVVVGPAQADFDLDRLNWNRIEAFLPAVRNAGFASPPEGRLHADIKRFDFSPKRTPSGDVDFRYDQGRLKLKALPQDLSQINMTGTLRGDQLNLDAWNMNFGTSPAEGRLNIQSLFSAPIFKAEARARGINLASVLSAQPMGQPQPEGALSFEVSVGGSGKVPEMILPSLTGSGHFRIENPVIRNLNVLDQIFTKLSAIPGMNEAVNQRASDKLKERLARRDTSLQTIDQDFSLQNQTIYFESFEAVTPDLRIRGPINLRLDGEVQAQPTVWIHEEIMAELVDRVHELAFALNPQGQLQIPLNVSGKLPQISVLPDVQFLLGEIVRNRSQQMAGQIAQRIASGKGPGSLSQILGIKSYETDTAAASGSAQTATTAAEDNSVPVTVHPQSQSTSLLDAFTGTSQNSSKNRNAQIAAGLLNSLLSSGEQKNSGGSSQN